MLPAVPYNTTCAVPPCPAPFISSMVQLGPLVNAKKLPGVRLREYWVLFVAFGLPDPRYYITPCAAAGRQHKAIGAGLADALSIPALGWV